MKRTRIGNIDVDTNKYYFVLNTPLWQMKQSEVRIMSYLDVLQEQANVATIESEINRIYNEMDKYFCLAQIVENINDNPTLINAFYVFNEAVKKGTFNRTYADITERNDQVNEAVVNIVNDCINYTIKDTSVIDVDMWIWWKENILNCNYYTNPVDGAAQKEKPLSVPTAISGGYDYVETFKKSAISFCYSAVSPEVVKKSKVATLKRKKQNEVRNTLNVCDVQLDSVVQRNYINSGVAAATNGGTPLQFVNSLKAVKQVGISETVIVAIISAAVTFLTALTKMIVDTRRDRLNDEAKLSLNTANQYVPAESDFLNIDLDGDGRSDAKKILLAGGALLLLYYYL